MLDEALEKPKQEPPRIGMYVAVLLELSMLACFAYHRSITGAFIWFAYLYFSATWSLFWALFRNNS